MKFERKRSGYRSREEILSDILSLIVKRSNVKKTHILYEANLNHAQLKKYLTLLVRAGLVTYNELDQVYAVTEDGTTFLRRSLTNARILRGSSVRRNQR